MPLCPMCGSAGQTCQMTVEGYACHIDHQGYPQYPANYLPGVQIQVYTDPGYAKLLASATSTTTNSKVTFDVPSNVLGLYVQITYPTGRIASPFRTYINKQCGVSRPFFGVPAPGYGCLPSGLGYNCPLPASKILYVTDTFLGNTTLTLQNGGWGGSLNWNCPNLVGNSTKLGVSLTPGFGLSLNGYLGQNVISRILGGQGITSCPPGFSQSVTYQTINPCNVANAPPTSTITVTE